MRYTRSKRKLKKTCKKRRSLHGGLLVMNAETDLVNTHLCNLKDPSKTKKSPGEEVYEFNGDVCQLNESTLGFVQQQYRKSHHNWFKFVIINNNNTLLSYVISGGKINKHSACMLLGVLDATEQDNEYPELRKAVNELLRFKKNVSPLDIATNPSKSATLQQLINDVNQWVTHDFQCMPVVSSGSGTVNSDKSLCINNKSGHYKPTPESMQVAKQVFEQMGATVVITEKTDKTVLKNIYGDEYEQYTGMCV